MVAVWGFALLIGSAVVLGHDMGPVTTSSPSSTITKMAHPTPNTDIWSSYQSMISQHEKQLSIAEEADSVATRAKWNWLELLRRQDSANETETSTFVPPTSTKTKTFTPTTRTSASTRTTRVPPSTTTSTSSISSTTSSSTTFSSPTPTPTTTTTTPSTTSSTSTTSSDSTTSRKTTDDDTPTPKPTKSSESITPTSKTVVRTTTLANGQASTFTSVRVISATAENAVSQTKGAPSLQTGGADSSIDRPAGGEVVALIGAALGVAYLL